MSRNEYPEENKRRKPNKETGKQCKPPKAETNNPQTVFDNQPRSKKKWKQKTHLPFRVGTIKTGDLQKPNPACAPPRTRTGPAWACACCSRC